MPYKDKEYAKQRAKELRELNPELYKQRRKEEYKRNKEKYKKRSKEYREKNKDKLNEYSRIYSKNYDDTLAKKKYYQSDKGKKARMKTKWKSRNVNIENFDNFYDKYINCNNCEWCKKDISLCKQMEHNHLTGEIRGIVCRGCNNRMRKKDEIFNNVMKDLIIFFNNNINAERK